MQDKALAYNSGRQRRVYEGWRLPRPTYLEQSNVAQDNPPSLARTTQDADVGLTKRAVQTT